MANDKKFTNDEIVDSVRSDIKSPAYRDNVPKAADVGALNVYGALKSNSEYYNNFVSTLVNKIGMTIFNSRAFKNPLQQFNKGKIERAAYIEEVMATPPKPQAYTGINNSPGDVFKTAENEVHVKIHKDYLRVLYERTINETELNAAFHSEYGLSDFITGLIDGLYDSENQDAYLMSRYVLSRAYLDNSFPKVEVPAMSYGPNNPAKTLLTAMNIYSARMTRPDDVFIPAGIVGHTPADKQLVVFGTEANGFVKGSQADTFHPEYQAFLGNRIEFDFHFTKHELNRLKELAEITNQIQAVDSKDCLAMEIKPFTDEEQQELAKIASCIMDPNFFFIFDREIKMTEQFDARGLYTNYFYHVHRIYSWSPFYGVVFFVQNPELESPGELIPGEPGDVGLLPGRD